MVLLQEQETPMRQNRQLRDRKSGSEILAPGKGGLKTPWATDSLIEGAQTTNDVEMKRTRSSSDPHTR